MTEKTEYYDVCAVDMTAKDAEALQEEIAGKLLLLQQYKMLKNHIIKRDMDLTGKVAITHPGAGVAEVEYNISLKVVELTSIEECDD